MGKYKKHTIKVFLQSISINNLETKRIFRAYLKVLYKRAEKCVKSSRQQLENFPNVKYDLLEI